MKTIRISAVATALLFSLAGLGAAQAQVDKNVQQKLKGQIIVTENPLPDVADGDTAKVYKKLNKKALKSTEVDGIPAWSFYYTAFLKNPPGATKVAFEFYTVEKKPRFMADKRLMGVDPKVKVLSGSLTLSEDDGLNKNQTYDLKLVANVRGRDVILATTRLTTK